MADCGGARRWFKSFHLLDSFLWATESSGRDSEQQVASLGLEQNFLFLGRRADIPKILGCCDIAVLPSRAEGLPNAVLEYMAAGLPVIASRVGGNAELINDGVTGLLVPPEDSSALSSSLLKLLRDPALAQRIAQGGHEFDGTKFQLREAGARSRRNFTANFYSKRRGMR